jgi:drug/metabolite transporter (DMT)-like permease
VSEEQPDSPETSEVPLTTAAGNTLVYFWGSLLVFGVFLVLVPGQQSDGRAWLWVGLLLLLASVVGFTFALRARLRYLRKDGRS